MKVERHFKGKNHLRHFFQKKFTLSDFEKLQVFFKKTPQISNVFRNLTIPVTLYGKFAAVWWKKIRIQKRE